MVIICEGCDSVGKSTLIRNLLNYFYFRDLHSIKPVRVSYFSNFKAPTKYAKNISQIHYRNGFNDIKSNNYTNDSHIIYDRFHIGEVVYSPLYRNYDGDYVYELENEYMPFLNRTLLVLLIDDAENLIKRDDGLSFTTELDKKQDEINRFISAYNNSKIPNKLYINIKELNTTDVAELVINEIKRLNLE